MRKLLPFFVVVYSCAGQFQAIPSDAARLSPSEVETLLRRICPGHESGGLLCGSCFESSSTPFDTWEVRAIYPGHFLSPSSQDALVSGFGCEGHANSYGGSYLITRDGSSWRRVWYASGMTAWDCRKMSGADGRDRLLCGEADGGQGTLAEFLYLLDPGLHPGKPEDDRGDLLFEVEDNVGAGENPMQSGTIERVEFEDLAASHHVRIVVIAKLGQATVPARVIERAASAKGPGFEVATVLRRYEFVFDGGMVVPGRNNPPMAGFIAVAPNTSYSVAK